jgi:hypothetical protein
MNSSGYEYVPSDVQRAAMEELKPFLYGVPLPAVFQHLLRNYPEDFENDFRDQQMVILAWPGIKTSKEGLERHQQAQKEDLEARHKAEQEALEQETKLTSDRLEQAKQGLQSRQEAEVKDLEILHEAQQKELEALEKTNEEKAAAT